MGRKSTTGYPETKVGRKELLLLIFEHNGSIKTTSQGWSVYDEMADRCGLTANSRNRGNVASTDTRPHWRAKVGWYKKDLELDKLVMTKEESGVGYWTLTQLGIREAERLTRSSKR